MSALHTPGPWMIGTETRGDEICTVHGVPRQPTEDGVGQGWVYIHYPRVIGGDFHWANENEKLANACLIAAAPELLAALKEAVEEVEDLRHYANSHGGMIENERCDYGRAAIAKAEARRND